jgi:clan AA aspartic protease
MRAVRKNQGVLKRKAIAVRRAGKRQRTMGVTHVTVAVSNPATPNRRWESLFLVDTGATDCLAPAKHLRAAGIKPVGSRTYELADGTEIKMKIGVAQVEFMGEVVGATIIFGDDDAEPILGVTALESVGIEVDPLNQRLKRLPAVRLKMARKRGKR